MARTTALFALLALTVSAQCPATITTFPWIENFDATATNNSTTPPAGWTQDLTDATGQFSDWIFKNDSTSTVSTGPTADHTTGVSGAGYYAYVEDSFPGNYPMVNLITPCFDISTLIAPQLRFWLHSADSSNGSDTNSLHIDVIVGGPGGTLVLDVVPPIGDTGTLWVEQVVDLTAFFGVIQVRFRVDSTNGGNLTYFHDIAIDDVEVFDQPAVDVGVVSIDSPLDDIGCSGLSTAEIVTVTVRNFGTLQLPAGTQIPISYTVDGGTPVSESYTLPAPFALNDTFTYAFATPADLSVAGPHVIDAATALVGDQFAGNDAVTGYTVQSGGYGIVTTFPWTEDFDASTWNGLGNGSVVPPLDWIQETGENAGGVDDDWYFKNVATFSTGTGPSEDHTTGVSGMGYFAYVEDSGGNHAAVNLRTPCLDISGLANPHLRFWYHSVDASGGGTSNALAVDVLSYPGGAVTLDILPPIGPAGPGWHEQLVDLSAFSGTIRIRFRGRSDGGAWTHDLAIDDVTVFDLVLGSGQAPQPGMASLDVSGALEANGQPVSSGFPGPYAASLTAGDAMEIIIEGGANQPILLLSGPLNPGLFTLPGSGQIDVGTPTASPPFVAVTIVSDGSTLQGFLPQLFVTDHLGRMSLSFSTTGLAPGMTIPLQAAVLTPGPSVLFFSNAVEVTTF